MEEDNSFSESQYLLEQALRVLQTPEANVRKEDYTALESLIRSMDVFETYLEAPANLHDFSQHIKYHIDYQVLPYGSVVLKESDTLDNFYVILKGSVQKLQQRSFQEIELEMKAEETENWLARIRDDEDGEREQLNNSGSDQSSFKKELPGYLRHTSLTKKRERENNSKMPNYAETLNKILKETKNKKIIIKKNASGNTSKEKIDLNKSNVESAGSISPKKVQRGAKRSASNSPVKRAASPTKSNNGKETKDNENKRPEETQVSEVKKEANENNENVVPLIPLQEGEGNNSEGIKQEGNGEEQKVTGNEEVADQTEGAEVKKEGQEGEQNNDEKKDEENPNQEENKERIEEEVNEEQHEEEDEEEEKQETIEEEEEGEKEGEDIEHEQERENEEAEAEEEDEKDEVQVEEKILEASPKSMKNQEKPEKKVEIRERKNEDKRNQDRPKRNMHGMSAQSVKFIKDLAANNPELKDKFFAGEILRVKTERNFALGDYFGEDMFIDEKARAKSFMAVSSEEVHLLVITRKSFNIVMAEIEKKSHEKANFFMDLFPSYDQPTLRKFAYNFSEKEFKNNDVIFSQGEKVEEVYVLKYGDIRLIKEVDGTAQELEQAGRSHLASAKNNGKIGLPIIIVMKNQFFGDEVFIKQELRSFTAIATGTTVATYFLKVTLLNQVRGQFGDLLSMLRDQTRDRFAWRDKRVNELVERRQLAQKKVSSPREALQNMAPKKALKYQLGFRWSCDSEYLDIQESAEELKKSQQPSQNHQENNKKSSPQKTRGSEKRGLFSNPSLGGKRRDFSLEAKIADKLVDGGFIRRMVEDGIKRDQAKPVMVDSFIDFNVMRELADKSEKKMKLPKIQSSRSPDSPRNKSINRSVSLKQMEAETERIGNIHMQKKPKKLLSVHSSLLLRSQQEEELNDDLIDKRLRNAIHKSYNPPAAHSSNLINHLMENLAQLRKKNSVSNLEKDSSSPIVVKSQKALKNRFSVNLKTMNMAKVYLEKGFKNSVDYGKKPAQVAGKDQNN